jgi:hypothetical protein
MLPRRSQASASHCGAAWRQARGTPATDDRALKDLYSREFSQVSAWSAS